ncbi:MAG: glycosyltransferase [Deltaproteobacteria bacterium]|nr:glycosyltransferase [Deltaproteobacteria bacterium]
MTPHILVSYHTCPMEEPGEGLAGGMNILLRGLLKGLGEAGMPTDVLTRATGETVEVTTPFPGVRVFHVPCFWLPRPTRESAWESLEVFIEKSRLLLHGEGVLPDVVSAHYWMSGVAALKLSSAPMILSYHTVEARKARSAEEAGRPLAAVRIEQEERLAREASRLVFFTGHDRERNLRVLPGLSGKAVVIPPGIDDRFRVPLPREVARSFLGLSPGGVIFLFAARSDPGKDSAAAVEAFRSVRSRWEEKPSLLIAGREGGAEPPEEGIVPLGVVPHDSMAVLYSAADAVICPSRYESFGLVPLESLSAAVPVIVPEGTYWGEKVRAEGGGLAYDPDDPEGLAGAMTALLADPSLRARLSVAGPKAAESFTWGKCTGAWMELLASVSRSGNPR